MSALRLRRRLASLYAPIGQWSRALSAAAARTWRQSLQLRVVVSTLSLSLIVISILGMVLTSQITDRLTESKIDAATEELGRARNTVESQLAGAENAATLANRIQLARSALTNRETSNGTDESTAAGTFDPVLIVPADGPRAQVTSGPAEQIPDQLRAYIQAGQVSYQFATVTDANGNAGRVLIVGSPTTGVDPSTLELYLVFPLAGEEQTLSLVRGTLLIGGAVLLVLLAAISLLVARQVVLPIRSASRIAVRFADGRLRERMAVRGEDDMARLAMSFNEMAESLSRQISQLEDFGNLQRQFTSDVSHELRTPLTTVRMAADLIHDSSDELDPTLRRASELLVAELDRFETLLGDLLEISRHDAGVAELSVEQLDVRACVRAALSTVRHLAKDSATELIVDLPDDEVIAQVDPRRVERILRNLLANAIDHGEGKPVLIRMRADDQALAIIVRDQGVGLRPGEDKLVFNRFWRSDPSRVRRSGGTGLGLAISLEDARLHNGRLEAWGEIGSGACFRLTLPRTRGRRVTSSPLPLSPTKRRLPVGMVDTYSDELPVDPTVRAADLAAVGTDSNSTVQGSPTTAVLLQAVPGDDDANGRAPDGTAAGDGRADESTDDRPSAAAQDAAATSAAERAP